MARLRLAAATSWRHSSMLTPAGTSLSTWMFLSERGDGLRHVQRHGRADDDGVEAGFSEHLGVVEVSLLGAQRLFGLGQPFGVDVAHRPDVNAQRLARRPKTRPAPARSDDAHTDSRSAHLVFSNLEPRSLTFSHYARTSQLNRRLSRVGRYCLANTKLRRLSSEAATVANNAAALPGSGTVP